MIKPANQETIAKSNLYFSNPLKKILQQTLFFLTLISKNEAKKTTKNLWTINNWQVLNRVVIMV